MHKRKGSSRVAYLFPSLGIAVKVARGKPITAVVETVRLSWNGEWQEARAWWQIPMRDWRGARYMVFRGVWDNLREWWFYMRYRHPILAATYLTLGLVNVQRLVVPFSDGERSRWFRGLCAVTGVASVRDLGDAHAFASDNFGMLDGRVRAIDYPGPIVQALVRAHGDPLLRLDLVSPP